MMLLQQKRLFCISRLQCHTSTQNSARERLRDGVGDVQNETI